MAKRSEFTEVSFEIAEEGKQMYREAMKARPIPFGMERVGLEAARQTIRNMTPKERASLARQVGLDGALALFKPYGRDDNAGR